MSESDFVTENNNSNQNNNANETNVSTTAVNSGDSPQAAKWQPLSSFQRRVVGVLIEKAKTTPDSYPMTINSIVTACNQKSNRSPQMDIATDDTMLTLDELREMGVVVEIHGSGRVARYRHKAYEWFGVDKVELAVLAELLLRGEQTVGELRGRAARMEPIADLSALRPVLESLVKKKLVIELTSPGRGQIVTHGVYLPGELDRNKMRVYERPTEDAADVDSPKQSSYRAQTEQSGGNDNDALRDQIAELTRRIERIESELGI